MNIPLYILAGLGIKKILDQTPMVDKTIRFNKNREFTILQLTDFHYGESEEKDSNNDEIHQILIDLVKPDMVTITGDAVSGFAWDGKEKDFYYKGWKRMTDVYTRNKVLYAYTLGNHDH